MNATATAAPAAPEPSQPPARLRILATLEASEYGRCRTSTLVRETDLPRSTFAASLHSLRAAGMVYPRGHSCWTITTRGLKELAG